MKRRVPAHVYTEAVLSALLEARPADLTIVQLMAATERTRVQVHTGLAHLRQVAAAKGLPPVTWDKTWGYRMLEDAPEVWIGYEWAFFESVLAWLAARRRCRARRAPAARAAKAVLASCAGSSVTSPCMIRQTAC